MRCSSNGEIDYLSCLSLEWNSSITLLFNTSERLVLSAEDFYQEELLSNNMTDISCVELLRRLLAVWEKSSCVARSVLISVVVLVRQGRRLDARDGLHLNVTFGLIQSDVSVGLYTMVVTY